jgi:hypothetical protein
VRAQGRGGRVRHLAVVRDVTRYREDLPGQVEAFGSMRRERELDEAERRRDLGLPVLPVASAPSSPAGHSCRSGWRGEDLAGRPVPCLVCRPHLASAVAAGRRAARELRGKV